HGSPLSWNDYATLAGSRIAPSQSRIAGRRGTPSVTPRLRPSLFVSMSTSSSRRDPQLPTQKLGARLPSMHEFRESVAAGGLMSYGPNLASMFRRAAELADKVLRGTKPGDIPVEQPTKFDLVVNLITARALGLTIPLPLLARADEVIE